MKLFGPPKNKETLPRYLLKYKFQFIISSIGGIIYNTVIVLSPILLGRLIDAAGGEEGQQVLLSALYFIGVTAFFQFARLVKRWFMRDQFNRVACDLRQTFIERTLGRQAADLEQEKVGDLMSRTVGDVTLVVDTVMTTLNEGWDTWLLMIAYFVAMLFQNWWITLIASIMVPVTLVIAQLMRHVLYRYSMSARKAAAESNSNLQRYLSAIAVLRLFGREKDEAEEIHRAFNRQASFNIKEILIQQALLPIYALFAGLGIVAVIGLGIPQVVRGDWTVGSFNAFLIMFIAFSGRTRVAARVFNRWHSARAAWARIREKIQQPSPEFTDENGEIPEITDLEIKDLCFGFGNGNFLKEINFTAHRGQIIGITGPVGSGKSLLAGVMTGLYAYEGNILVDGRELSSISSEERNKLIAYAGHEQFLFSMSIEENITITAPSENQEIENRLHAAIRTASLDKDLDRFPDGLASKVGEKGASVSGGQRQRIALARAVFAQSPILILDDPFSAVDIATEDEIIQSLRRDSTDRIILLFSHRLTTFHQTDHILVLSQGKVLQSGPHSRLSQEAGLYRDIYQAQAFMEDQTHEAQ
jgi:ATP-binding cassette, subfamily B, multidrug efflux pump